MIAEIANDIPVFVAGRQQLTEATVSGLLNDLATLT